MKIPLQKRKEVYQANVGGVPWSSCSPYVENSRAVLVHRPRYVTTHKIGERYKPHLAIEFWCGTSSTGTKKFTFLDAPPDGRLLCARCEAKAIEHGQPSSEQLTGKHAHLGGMVAIQICCSGQTNVSAA